ncbi:MAG: 16S rRNA (guanine(527)-N(7))-methyltransferase RsmG [Bacilli bacterium]|nr:16S rRNA (guanine(527)-N(7))-methyltransferase RsmG [Bacilli bacterium]
MFQERIFLDPVCNKHLKHPKFEIYYQYLIEVNAITNLTRITDVDSVYYKHFYDSIILSKHINLENKTLLDVGAGAGFPSLPLKIVEDSLQVTIVDSLNKRIQFLQALVEKLKLDNVVLLHNRAEELDCLNQYDIVTSRAVARLNILIELTLPFVKVGGYFIAYKGSQYQEELDEALNGIKILGGELERIESYDVDKDETHVLIIIRKVHLTKSIYPRVFGQIKKNPL